jgi:hypothetical protein
MEKTNIMISRSKFAADYIVIDKEGKYSNLKVASKPQEYYNERLAEVSPNYSHSYLINFKAVEGRNVDAVLAAFGNENAIDLAELRPETEDGRRRQLLMVHEVIVNINTDTGEIAAVDLPAKNETVTASFEYAKNEDGFVEDREGNQILNLVSMRINPAAKAKGFSFGDAAPFMAGDAKDEATEAKEAAPKKEKATA